MSTEIGILTQDMIKWASKLLDSLIAFKNVILETADGPAWSMILNGVNKNLATKIPEPQQTEIRDLLNEIWIDKDYDSASKKAADLYFTLINLKFLDDELERQIFVNLFMMVAHALAKLNTDGQK